MMGRSRGIAVLAFFLFLGLTATAGAASPQAVVEGFQERLIGVMREAKTLSIRERYDRLYPAIEEAFHLKTMIAIAVGPFWNRADAAQRDRLVEAFARKNISTVATLFDDYSGQIFETLGEREAPQSTQLVQTRLKNPDGSSVRLDYRLLAVNGRWRIIDVIVDDGISELSVRRSEYRRILESRGLEGLISELNAKADVLLAP